MSGPARDDEAEKLLRRALSIDEEAVGANHFLHGMCLANRAAIFVSSEQVRRMNALLR
jgi:hypothetical protein